MMPNEMSRLLDAATRFICVTLVAVFVLVSCAHQSLASRKFMTGLIIGTLMAQTPPARNNLQPAGAPPAPAYYPSPPSYPHQQQQQPLFIIIPSQTQKSKHKKVHIHDGYQQPTSYHDRLDPQPPYSVPQTLAISANPIGSDSHHYERATRMPLARSLVAPFRKRKLFAHHNANSFIMPHAFQQHQLIDRIYDRINTGASPMTMSRRGNNISRRRQQTEVYQRPPTSLIFNDHMNRDESILILEKLVQGYMRNQQLGHSTRIPRLQRTSTKPLALPELPERYEQSKVIPPADMTTNLENPLEILGPESTISDNKRLKTGHRNTQSFSS